MEPRAAVAAWEGDQLTVWAGTQRPFGIRTELAQRFGIEESQVRVIAPEIGGGFGSKSPYPVAHEAARLARIAGRPVRVAYTRAEDMIYATMRPAALITHQERLHVGRHASSRGSSTRYHAGDRPFLGRRGSETPVRRAAREGDDVHVGQPAARRARTARSARAANHFAREVHIDEIAAAVGVDPVELRLRNLSHPRFRRVLERAADAHGWQRRSGASRRGQGVAIGLDVGSYVATCVAARRAGHAKCASIA